MRTMTIRSEVQRLLKQQPFEPFALTLENGEIVVVEHPENIAFDPSAKSEDPRANEFYVFTKKLRVFSTFSAVSSVSLLDRG